MAFEQIKFLSLFALLATSALVASANDPQPEQAAATGAAAGEGADVLASIQKDLKDIAKEAKSAITQIGNGAQQSQVGQGLKAQLQEIIKQADDNGKKLAEGIGAKSVSEQVKGLGDSKAIQAIVQDFESINMLVVGAAKQAAQSGAGGKVSESLQKILDHSREAVENLKSPLLTEAVSKGFDQLTTQAQAVLDSIRNNPAAQIVQSSAQAIGSHLQKSLSGLSDQVKSGDLEKNVQGYLDGFADYAKSTASTIGNFETVKLLQNSLGSLGLGSLGLGSGAASPKAAAAATEAEQAAPAPAAPTAAAPAPAASTAAAPAPAASTAAAPAPAASTAAAPAPAASTSEPKPAQQAKQQ